MHALHASRLSACMDPGLLHFVCTAGGTATPHAEQISVRMTSSHADMTRQVLPTSCHVQSFVDWLPQVFTFESLKVISFDVFYLHHFCESDKNKALSRLRVF